MIKNLGTFAHPPKTKMPMPAKPKSSLIPSKFPAKAKSQTMAMANQQGMDTSDSLTESIGPDLMPAVKPSAPVIGMGNKKAMIKKFKFTAKSKNPFFG